MASKTEEAIQSTGLLLWQAHNKWQSEFKHKLKPINLTHVQFLLLNGIAELKHRRKAITQIMLSELINADIAMTSTVLADLEKRELVIRLPHPSDKRAKILALSEEGRRIVRQARKFAKDFESEFFRNPSGFYEEFSKTLLYIAKEKTEKTI